MRLPLGEMQSRQGQNSQKSGLGRLGAFPRVGEGLKGNSWVRLYPVGS